MSADFLSISVFSSRASLASSNAASRTSIFASSSGSSDSASSSDCFAVASAPAAPIFAFTVSILHLIPADSLSRASFKAESLSISLLRSSVTSTVGILPAFASSTSAARGLSISARMPAMYCATLLLSPSTCFSTALCSESSLSCKVL